MRHFGLLIIFILFFAGNTLQAEENGTIDIHGFIAQGFLQTSDNNFMAETKKGTLEFNEMGINFTTSLNDRLNAGMQFFARDLGDFGNDEIEVDWVFADYSYKPWLGVRVGKTRCPFGLYNKTRDVDMLRTEILLPQGVYNEGWRDSLSALKGGSLYGTMTLGLFGNLNYNVLSGNMDFPKGSGVGKFASNRADITNNSISSKTAYFSGLFWEMPVDGLRIGVSTSRIDVEINANTNNGSIWQYRTVQAMMAGAGSVISTDDYIVASGGLETAYSNAQMAGVDLVDVNILFPFKMKWFVYSIEYIWDELILACEYSKNTSDYNMTSVTTGRAILTNREVVFEGWYTSASYRFSDFFEMGLYYTEFYPNKDDKDGLTQPTYGYPVEAGWYKDWCLSMRFDINENWVFKIEGHSLNGLAVIFMDDQERLVGGGYNVDKDWLLGAVKISYSF